MAKKRKSKKLAEAPPEVEAPPEPKAEAEPMPEEPAEPGPDPADESNYEPTEYVIAKGRSICCARGILTEGMTVSQGDINNNPDAAEEHFNAHFKMGHHR